MDMSPQEREAAARRIPENLLTEPMSIKILAGLFGVHRNKMAVILKRYLPGAENVGGSWRVPVAKMPPAYFEERGISIFDAPDCTDKQSGNISSRANEEN